MKLLVGLALLFLPAVASAEIVIVKYRGPIDLKPLTCQSVTRSSFVQRVCYDTREQYMIINLTGTYYHYCEIPQKVVGSMAAG